MKKIVTGNYRSYNNLVDAIHFYIQLDLESTLKKIAEDIKKTLHDFIQMNWYSARPTTEFYDRTFDIIDSLKIDDIQTVGDRKEVFIYFDDSEIYSVQTLSNKWNQHLSIDGSESYNGISIGEWVVNWLDEGQNSPLYSYGGIHFIDNIIDNKDKFVKELNDLLKKKKYICIVK